MSVSRPNNDSVPSARTPSQEVQGKQMPVAKADAVVGPGQTLGNTQNLRPFSRTVSPVNETRDLTAADGTAGVTQALSGLAATTAVDNVVPGTTPELQSQIAAYLQKLYPAANVAEPTSNSSSAVNGEGTSTEGQAGLATATDYGIADASQGAKAGATATAQDATAQPAMDTANGSVRYAQVRDASQETLFGTGGPTQDDIQQRDDGTETNGDCPIMSAMAALADQDPGAVQNMIQQTGDNTYNVTLYYAGKPETYAVDDSVPVDNSGKPTGAQLTIDPSSGKAVLWPSLVEKAYAKLQDVHPGLLPWSGVSGYQDLDQGGTGADALATLTGKKVYQTDPRSAGDAQVQGLLGLSNQGIPVTVMTGLTTDGGTLPSGLQPNHIYSVVSTWQDSSGRDMALLRNPWGEDPNQDSADEPGLISVPVASIESDCRGINAGDVVDDQNT